MTGAPGAIDLDHVVAIDVHTHAEVSAVTGCGSLSPELEAAADEYFRNRERRRPTLAELAAYYRERRMVAVVFTVDATATQGVADFETLDIKPEVRPGILKHNAARLLGLGGE
ncbi:MAG TPA: hypothetical protein VFI47_17650 [Acidimicrobiales bacterium]|nr:hypothetical protein [Acidimicrobiales bacterium]